LQLIAFYVVFMIAGDLLAYGIGYLVEAEFGSRVSFVVFLALYFLFLWVAWLLAVRVTEPKAPPRKIDARPDVTGVTAGSSDNRGSRNSRLRDGSSRTRHASSNRTDIPGRSGVSNKTCRTRIRNDCDIAAANLQGRGWRKKPLPNQ
jgi:hypothetical protein